MIMPTSDLAKEKNEKYQEAWLDTNFLLNCWNLWLAYLSSSAFILSVFMCSALWFDLRSRTTQQSSVATFVYLEHYHFWLITRHPARGCRGSLLQ